MGGNTAEETNAHYLEISQVSDKINAFSLHSWSSRRRLAKRRNKRAALVQWHLDNRSAQRDEEQWEERGGGEGINHPWPPASVSQELSPARKFKLKVQRSAFSLRGSTEMSNSVRTHQQLHWQQQYLAVQSWHGSKQMRTTQDRETTQHWGLVGRMTRWCLTWCLNELALCECVTL